MLTNILKGIGAITIIGGIIGGIYVGATLEAIEVLTLTKAELTEPHPLRWVYGLGIIASSVLIGSISIAVAEILRIVSPKKAKVENRIVDNEKVRIPL